MGAWNRILAGIPRLDSRCTRRRKHNSMLLLLLLMETTIICLRKLIRTTQGVVDGFVSGGNSLFEYIVAFKNDFVSIITRLLMIMSGDVELNPGPSKINVYNATDYI